MKKKTMALLLCAMMSAAVFAQDEKKEVDRTPKIGGTIRSKYEYRTEEGGGTLRSENCPYQCDW